MEVMLTALFKVAPFYNPGSSQICRFQILRAAPKPCRFQILPLTFFSLPNLAIPEPSHFITGLFDVHLVCMHLNHDHTHAWHLYT